jgi:hypothetical protein
LHRSDGLNVPEGPSRISIKIEPGDTTFVGTSPGPSRIDRISVPAVTVSVVITMAVMMPVDHRRQMDDADRAWVPGLVHHAGRRDHHRGRHENRRRVHNHTGRDRNYRRRAERRNRESDAETETNTTGLRRRGRHADADCC